MIRSSSLPNPKAYSEKNKTKLPKITKNSLLPRNSKKPKKYNIINKEISNGGKPSIYDQLNAIENNYYEMKFILNDKINRLEKNQRKVNNFLKYSLEQDRLQNDINNYNYQKNFNVYKSKNRSEKSHILKMLNEIPEKIENKFNKLYLNELEENRNQKYFFNKLKERMTQELDYQRKFDYLKYKKHLDELKQMRDYEEKEKMLLYNQIENQKYLNQLQEMKYQNELFKYQVFGELPFLNLIRNNNNNNKQDSIGLNIDELIKIYLFKEMLNSSRINYEYQNLLLNSAPLGYNKINNGLLDSYYKYGKRKVPYRKIKNKSFLFNNRYINNDYSMNEDEYSTNIEKIPFINSGKSYSKDKNYNLSKRFTTSHNEKYTKYTKEKEKKIYKKKLSNHISKKSKSNYSSNSESPKSENENNENSEDESEDKKEDSKNKKKSKKKERKEEEENSEESDTKNENSKDTDKNQNQSQPPQTSQQPQTSKQPQTSPAPDSSQ